jgi:hypothetical protein
MRTTLTLDDDLMKSLQGKARRTGETWKDVVNSTLRIGLRAGEKPAPALPRFEVKAKGGSFRAGVDLLRLNQLNDELEIEEFQRRISGTGAADGADGAGAAGVPGAKP